MVPAVMRGSGARCAEWPVRRAKRPGSPQPARHAPSPLPARVLLRPDADSACLGPVTSVEPRPPLGRGVSTIRRTRRIVSRRDLPCGVKHLPGCTTTRRRETVGALLARIAVH